MRRTLLGCALAAGALLTVTACSSDDSTSAYQTDYTGYEPLHVVGYPSTGSLGVVQEAVWRLADGDTDALADLSVEDGPAEKTARNWVESFGRAAKGEVTADFYDEGSTRQTVVLYFSAKSRQTKEITARIGDDDTWGLVLNESDPKEASTGPTWAPPSRAARGRGARAASSVRSIRPGPRTSVRPCPRHRRTDVRVSCTSSSSVKTPDAVTPPRSAVTRAATATRVHRGRRGLVRAGAATAGRDAGVASSGTGTGISAGAGPHAMSVRASTMPPPRRPGPRTPRRTRRPTPRGAAVPGRAWSPPSEYGREWPASAAARSSRR